MPTDVDSDDSEYIYRTNPTKLLTKSSFTVKGHSFTNPFYEGVFYVMSRASEARFLINKIGGQLVTFFNDNVSHVVVPDDVAEWFEVHKSYYENGLEFWLKIPGLNLTESSKKILYMVAYREKKIWKIEKIEKWLRFLKINTSSTPGTKRSHSMSFDDNSVYKKMRLDGRWKPISKSNYFAFVCENSGSYKPIIAKVYHRLTEVESQSKEKLTKFYKKSTQTPFIEPSSVSDHENEFDDNESGYTRMKSVATSIHSRKSLPNLPQNTNNSLLKEASSNRFSNSILMTPTQSIPANAVAVSSDSEKDIELSSIGTFLSSEENDEAFPDDEVQVGVSRKYHNITNKEGYCELCGERFKDFIQVF